MMTIDSDGDAMFSEATRNMSQEKQGQHKHDDANASFDADCDLKLWLQHTGFFDIEHRQKVLDALRKLKAIDEQRCKILSEIRTTTDYLVSPSISTMPQSPTALGSFSPSFLAAQKTDQSTAHGFTDYNALLCSCPAAFASSGERCSSEVSSANKGADSDNGYMTFGNRPSSSQQHDAPSIASIQNAHPSTEAIISLDDPDYESQEAESPPPLDSSIETEARHLGKSQDMNNYTQAQIFSSAPKQVQSRYFLVKSLSMTNVEMSQRDGLWITNAKNGALFTSAFQQHKNVFLIFSVNKSKAFQGYARMTTAPDADIAAPKWMSNIPWEASSPFRIEWLNTRRTEFWKLGELKNPFNDGAHVFVGRDGQEYPESCGRKIVRVMGRRTKERTASSWTARVAYGDANVNLADSYPRSAHGKDDISTWQYDDWSGAGAVLASTDPEPVDDMPLIQY